MSAGSTGIDENYYPPFPWCLVDVYNLPKTKKVTIKGYIDTGSDGTIITTAIDKELQLHRHPIAIAETVSIGGKPEVRPLYATIFVVTRVEVVTAVDIRDDVEEVLLGRDILRHLSLNVNWKEGTIDLSDP